jgi:S-adenosylmethionine synthetase
MYSETSAYGHMGRTNEIVDKTFTSPDGKSIKKKVELFTWEKLDAVKEVKKVFGLK